MKIGILTYYGDLNCGTNLQAFSTLRAVKSIYPNDCVEIIPFHGFNPDIHPYLSNCTIQSLLRDWSRIRKYRQFKQQQLEVKNDRIIQSPQQALAYIKARRYDIIFIGADTLLELNRLPQHYDGLSAYWLSPEIKARKILLAASAKNIEYDKLSHKQKADMEATLLDFSAFGVRDDMTRQLISHFIPGDKIVSIPDPTFSLEIDYHPIQSYLQKKHIEIPRKCICIHCYRTDKWAGSVAARLKTQGYTIASFRPMPWADLVLNDLSPLEQVGVFRYFHFVITHRFHEGIFSIKNKVPVLLYVSENTDLKTSNGDSKYSDLMKLFGLYPTNILDSGTIDAERILSQIPIALDAYHKNRQKLDKTLQELSDSYINFIKDTHI